MARRTNSGRQKPKRPWGIEPVPRPTPDLNKLAQVLATMAIDRAKANQSPTRANTSTNVRYSS